MTDTTMIEAYMRNANPIPDLDALDADEFARFVAVVQARREVVMQAPTPHPTRPTPTTPPAQRRRSVWAFAAAFVVILVVVGAAAVVLRGDNTQVTDEPAPPTTLAETPTERVEAASLTWTRIPVDEAAFGGADFVDVRDVTDGGPGLVAVGWGVDIGGAADAMVWTSPDGYTWSRVPHAESTFSTDSEHWEMHSITAGGPGLVAVGSQRPGMGLPGGHAALVWTSPDGTVWTRVPHQATFDDADLRDVTAGGPGLVAVGVASLTEGQGTAAVWSSPDGRTWSRAQVGGAQQPSVMTGVIVGGQGLVAVGREGSNAAVWTSPNGLAWSRVPHDEEIFGGKGIQAMASTTVGGAGIVAVGDDHGRAAVWTSQDGYSWSRVPHDEAIFGAEIRPEYAPQGSRDYYDNEHAMTDVIATTSGFVAVGREPNLPQAVIWTSSDGINWSRVPYEESVFGRGDQTPKHTDPSAGMRIHGVTAAGPGLVAVGQDALAWAAAVWIAEP